MSKDEQQKKSRVAQREEDILKFWEKHNIFEKTLAQPAPKGEFVFYEGPPTANGRPGIHHLAARAFKDLIPRFKTMRGHHVRRKGGWDTHGLPVELEVEKELGLKTKKDIESYGIAAFNKKCKESVWKYREEWERFTKRIGYWIDQRRPYVTYHPQYMESVWNVLKHVYKRGLLYKDYKVVPWCPRCGTALSSHELAQGYKDVSDASVFVKFKAIDSEEYFLAWTTTPWTLPGNVALAVKADVTYVKAQVAGEAIWFAKDFIDTLAPNAEILEEVLGRELVGRTYEPLFEYLKKSLPKEEQDKLTQAYTLYSADFVTTDEGTGIVHTAVMYGQDDFVLGTEVGLPKHHLVDESGKFTKDAGEYEGLFVKDADEKIIQELKHKNLLFKQATITHTYPFCWRCKTPLIYYARDSWYIQMSKLRPKLIAENEHIHWEPGHVRDGRFGEWLRDVKDWAISRSRYWGTPLPVWECQSCDEKKVIGSIDELKKNTKTSGNTYFAMRHGQAQSNIEQKVSVDPNAPDGLTDIGRQQVQETASRLIKKYTIDVVITSPFVRTKETADIVMEQLGLHEEQLVVDERIGEFFPGDAFRDKHWKTYAEQFTFEEQFVRAGVGGETRMDVKRRAGDFLYELEQTYAGKTILIVSHEAVLDALQTSAQGFDEKQTIQISRDFFHENASVTQLNFVPLPHNDDYELDVHRPYIDDITLTCSCGGEMQRVPDVMDVWLDSGAMPFAQDHYPFEGGHGWLFRRTPKYYPADYISEGMDQTRGWFYTLHAVGVLMGFGKAYSNVISLGLLNDAKGKKMSKSVGNVVDPWQQIDAYGVDVIRFWMYSITQPGETKSYDEQTVVDVERRVFNILRNTVRFYEMYKAEQTDFPLDDRTNVLDRWIITRFAAVQTLVTQQLDAYRPLEAARGIRDFVTDLSTWYIRRSRARFKSEDETDKQHALATTHFILLELAKLLAPFTPFLAEDIYRRVGGQKESVHLEAWPDDPRADEPLLQQMEEVRKIVSLGLEARASAGIKVRQPLTRLTVRKPDSPVKGSEVLRKLIADEVNVKEVVFEDTTGWDVEIDTHLTPELKQEGQYRELSRHIQQLRKSLGLSPHDVALLGIETNEEGEKLLQRFGDELKKVANLRDIDSSPVPDGATVNIDNLRFVIALKQSE